MKIQSRVRLALLALLPLLGCGALAWQGAHRPERLLVGTWQKEPRGFDMDKIMFRSDGTFELTGYTVCSHREWGRWHVDELGCLVMEAQGEQDCPLGDLPSHPLRTIAISMDGDTMRVDSPIRHGDLLWKRIVG